MPAKKIKKGTMVRVIREALENSVEATSSDQRFSPYVFETDAEILEVDGDYALIQWGAVPTPNAWLRIDQLEIL
ncbi:MAG: NAD(P)H-quinone oxidoreductase subunit O [Cyanobacteria bacterium P01_D01_bin.73]